MSLQLPVLDDTDFEQLLQGALAQIDARLGAEWSAAPESDPGRMLIEVMAYLTDQTIYRLNRLPTKVYVAFLRLLGHTLYPPTAAQARIEFDPQEGAAPDGAEIEIPRGTRITTEEASGGGSTPVFVTLEPIQFSLAPLDPGQPKPSVLARHCTWVKAEALGVGTGQPGLELQVAHPPIVASWGHREFDARLWVETAPDRGGKPHPERPDDDRRYLEWEEVPRFGPPVASRQQYTVDRGTGTIRFAPAARLEAEQGEDEKGLQEANNPLAAAPGQGMQILVSYAHGGGTAGNVLPKTLTRVVDRVNLIVAGADGEASSAVRPDEYITATNPERAGGGQEAETLENALLRGPLALYGNEQAVTARDYERLIMRAAATLGQDQIARVQATTQVTRWAYAHPGTVEVQLVPRVGPDETPRIELLRERTQKADLSPIEQELVKQAAIGTRAALQWAHYKPVRVRTKLAISDEAESPDDVKKAVRERLEQYIDPFTDPDAGTQGWPFGRDLRLDEVTTLIESTTYVDKVQALTLHVAGPHADVHSLAAHPHQYHADVHSLAADPNRHYADVWYAGSGGTLYRSLNDGQGWEEMHSFAGETIVAIRPSLDRAGLVGLVTADSDVPSASGASAPASARSRVYVSTDCARTWTRVTDFNYPIADLGWLLRADRTILLLATDRGLYEFELTHRQGGPPYLDVPSLVPIDAADHKAALYALTVVRGRRGQARVAVALQSRGGVFISDGADLVPDEVVLLDQAQLDELTSASSRPPSVPPVQTTGGKADGPVRSMFRRIPALDGQDVRCLAVQQQGVRSYLWAGTMAEGNEALGCYRWRIGRDEGRWFSDGWQGGSCRALAFDGSWAFAATQWGGVLKLDLDATAPDEPWQASTRYDRELYPPVPSSFLRVREGQRSDDYGQKYRPYKPLWTLSVGSSGTLMAGGESGILRRLPPSAAVASGGDLYAENSAAEIDHRTYGDRHVTLPYDGLIVLDGYEVTSNRDGEAA